MASLVLLGSLTAPRHGTGPTARVPRDDDPVLQGHVRTPAGEPLADVLVTARQRGGGIAVSVFTDTAGQYRLDRLPPGPYRLEVRRSGFRSVVRDSVAAVGQGAVDLALERAAPAWDDYTSASLLRLLPDGETKRRFILDCTGCHQFDQRTVSMGPRLKTREEWEQRIRKMLSFAGAHTGFPIISPSRDATATAEWLVAGLGQGGLPRPRDAAAASRDAGAMGRRFRITEFDLPEAGDLPHDLALDAGGRVLVTGMFTHRLYVLDPTTGAFTVEEIPIEGANPRAVEIDSAGTWWVLLGGPQKLARRRVSEGDWTSWDLGMYPHSIGLGRDGLVWFNGHFTKDPELLGNVDPVTGEVSTYEVPSSPMPDGGSTIPYELRVGPDGAVWMTQLVGGRLVRFDPRSKQFLVFELPAPNSGPRRFDVDARGGLWVPEFAGNKLARFDVATETFMEHEFPVPDALPYVARVDDRRGAVWIGTAAADVMARFDVATATFDVIPLPTRGALVRHLTVDPSSGAVWGAYSPAPPRNPRIVRIETW